MVVVVVEVVVGVGWGMVVGVGVEVVVVVVVVVEVVVVVHSLSHNIALGPSHTFRSRVLVCLHVRSHFHLIPFLLSLSPISESTEQHIQPPAKCEQSRGGRGCVQ